MPSRRQFVRGTASGAAVAVFAPQTLVLPARAASSRRLLRSGRFADGIVSGDPTPNGITLWTRVADVEGAGRVELEVARDKSTSATSSRGKTIAPPTAVNHSVKARVEQPEGPRAVLLPLRHGNGDSQIGRFRTALPADSKQPVKFAFFSCQDYTHGYYNAYDVMAEDDYDFVVCLGRLHLRRGLPLDGRRHRRARRQDRQREPGNPDIVREAITLPGLPRQVLALPLRPGAARGPRASSRW